MFVGEGGLRGDGALPRAGKPQPEVESVTVLWASGLCALNISPLVGQGRKRRDSMKKGQASRNPAWLDIDLLWVEQVNLSPFCESSRSRGLGVGNPQPTLALGLVCPIVLWEVAG